MDDILGAFAKLDRELSQGSKSEQADSHPESMDSTIEQSSSGTAHTDADSASLSGTSLGRYQVEHLLGRGGFGEVWRGYDPELNRAVAIKLARMDREFSSAKLNALQEEARKAASLSHPGIVQVYDIVQFEQRFFVVSEFIEGETLSERLRRQPVSVDQAVSIVLDIARALHHAHTRDIIHRDVKPANILLRSNGAAVLTDLGLALFEQELPRQGKQLSGTIRFMSPEQAAGDMTRVDHRSDIYSLGLVLYYMLAGRLPFPVADTETYLRYLVTREPRPLRTIVESLPPELDRICMRCLEIAPKDRFSSCLELAESLETWKCARATGDTVVTSSVLTPSKWGDRPRVWLVGLVPVLAVLAVLAIVSLEHWSKYRPEPNPPAPPGFAPLPGSQHMRPDIPFVAEAGVWNSLLDQRPQFVTWPAGDGRSPPQFDAPLRQFAVRSERTRWIVQCAELESRPFHVRTRLHVDEWLGYAGIVWGLREDQEAFPEREYRCFTVEYFCSGVAEPSKLVASELTLKQVDFDEIRIIHRQPIAEQRIEFPLSEEVTFEMNVDAEGVRVRFGSELEWSPVVVFGKMNWLPDGGGAIGLTGQGRNVVFRSLSVRPLP
jgi:serine/threonine protein kinase